MKNFWLYLTAVCFGLLFAIVPVKADAAAPTANPTAADMASHVKEDKIKSCFDVQQCEEAAKKAREVWHSRWVQCLIPAQRQIKLEDGTYRVVDAPKFDWQPGQECKCPEGYTLSRSHRVQSVRQSEDVVHKTAFVSGVCLPLDTEPNAVVIADALNEQMKFIRDVNVELARFEGDILAKFDDLTGVVNYTLSEIEKLKGRVDALEAFMNGTCQQAQPGTWKYEVCNRTRALSQEVYAMKRRFKDMRVGGGFEYARFAGGRDVMALGVEVAWMPRLSESVQLEVGGRLNVAQADDMTVEGDKATAMLGTLYLGPAFQLDEQGQVKLHTRAFVQQLIQTDGFDAMGRRYGGEACVSFAPNAKDGDPGSFYVTPCLNLGQGRGMYREPATEDVPAHFRGEDGVTGGGNLFLGGQF